MFATRGRLPVGPQWRYEVRWGGLRVLAETTGGRVRLTTRDEHDVTASFPSLGGLAAVLADAVLDGELIVLRDGVPSVGALTRRDRTEPATFMVSDVLRLYGVPLHARPFDERRATLERLPLTVPGVAVSPVYDDGEALATAARRHGLGGVVAKDARSPYRPGVADPAWVETTWSTAA